MKINLNRLSLDHIQCQFEARLYRQKNLFRKQLLYTYLAGNILLFCEVSRQLNLTPQEPYAQPVKALILQPE